MPVNAIAQLLGGSSSSLYKIDHSARFRTAVLTRTPVVSGGRQKWTLSANLRRGVVGVQQTILASGPSQGSSDWTWVIFTSDDRLQVAGAYGNSLYLRVSTTAVFRDPTAHLHLCVQYDSTQSVGADRCKIHINGVRQAVSIDATLPLNDATSYVHAAGQVHAIGKTTNPGSYYFDGHISDLVLTDDVAPGPEAFGHLVGGVWVPDRYAGAFGTNGCFLEFKSPAALGTDSHMDTTVPSQLSCVRAGSATRVNASGLIEAVPANVLRRDFDPVTLACKGWLIEEARINSFTYSEQIDHANWTKARATVSADATTAPDGSATADKLVEDTTASATHETSQAVNFTSGTAYTFSVFAKAGGRSKFAMVYSGAVSGNQTVVFDLSAVTATVTNGAPTGTIKEYGNGWYRCTMTATASSTAANGCYVRLCDGSGNVSYTGDGASGLHLWGAQLEAGAFATSYIPTTSGSATRNADVLTVATSGFALNAGEGTVFAAFDCLSAGVQTEIMRLYDGVGGGVTLFRSAADALVWDYSSQQVSISNAIAANTTIKAAATYKATGAVLCVNGADPVVKADSAVPTGITTLALSGAAGGGLSYLNGHIRQIVYFPRVLSNAELQALTSTSNVNVTGATLNLDPATGVYGVANNFTPSGLLSTDQMTDTPTNLFPVWDTATASVTALYPRDGGLTYQTVFPYTRPIKA
ncbi:MAG: hypothetical protein HYU60_05290, partial [Magnetospirillum sp.]|nr:hypothetical protein [Magnetospirillum sp.]